MPDRISNWNIFSDQELKHIEQYTKIQYDDPNGNGQLDNWTPQQAFDQMLTYINRFGKGARGPIEQLRDILKMAHFCQIIYDKLKVELNLKDVYK